MDRKKYQVTFRPALKAGETLAWYGHSYKTLVAASKKAARAQVKQEHPWAVIERIEPARP